MLHSLPFRITSYNVCYTKLLRYKHRYVYTLIRTAKYYGYIHAPVVLGQALAPFLSEEIAEKNMYEEYLKPVLIPIPLHRKKYRERGYNQVERIAQALINAMESKNVTLDTSTLIRIKNTPSQAHQKSKTARVKNMHHRITSYNVCYTKLLRNRLCTVSKTGDIIP